MPVGQTHLEEPGGKARLLEASRVSKRFGPTQALVDVDITLAAGEVLALLGENGAGKSTLIKILAGVYPPDSGDLFYKGQPAVWGDLSHFSFVHQDLGLVGDMSIAENIALGYGFARTRARLISWRTVKRDARRALERVKLNVAVETPVHALSPAQRSLVAIARSLARDAQVLILDEPTATLGRHETETLFGAVEHLKSAGIGVIYVTHRLEEVFTITDRVLVLRNGGHVLRGATADFTSAQLAEAIAGRELSQARFATHVRSRGPSCLELTDVVTDEAGPVTLQIFPGEITALTGLVGAGQQAIPKVLRGDSSLFAGAIRLQGRSVTHPRASQMTSNAVTFTPTNRAEEGIAPGLTVRENLIPRPRNGASPLLPVNRRTEKRIAADLIARYNVRPPASEVLIMNLSGGNQQKVVVARALSSAPKIVVLEDPTIGVDIGAKDDLYRTLATAAEAGVAVVLVTTDMEEVGRVADRALVFRNGVVVADVTGAEVTEHRIMELALEGAGARATAQPRTSPS